MDLTLLDPKIVANVGIFGAICISLMSWILQDMRRRDEENKKREEENRAQSAAREERLMKFMESLAPIIQSMIDKIEANTAIVLRIEGKIDGCDTRRKKVLSSRASTRTVKTAKVTTGKEA